MRRELPPTSGLPPVLADLYREPRLPLSERLAASLSTPQVTLTPSGSAALVIAFTYLKQMAIGREIILPAFTCPLVAHAALKAGLSVSLCDSMPARFDLDMGMMGRIINPDTLAVVPTHFGGHLTPISPLRSLLRSVAPQIFIIEDAAQAYGARIDGKPVGFAGDIGLFSFAAGKGLTLYEGGCLVASDPVIRRALDQQAKTMLRPSWRWEWQRMIELLGYHLFYRPHGLSFVYGAPLRRALRQGNLIAALGDDKQEIPMHPLGAWRQQVGANAIMRWDAHLEASQRTARRLITTLSSVAGLDVHVPARGLEPSQTFLFVSLRNKRQADQALLRGADRGLGITRLFAHPLNRYPALAGRLSGPPTPQAQALSDRTLTVTTSPFMTHSEMDVMADLFHSVLRGR